MYQVKIRQTWKGEEVLIHSAHANSLKLVNPIVTLDTAAVNTFTFDIYPDNVGYSQLKYLTTMIRVHDTRKHADIFEGRVLLVSDSIDSSTPMHKSVTCEAIDAFLNDSISPYLVFKQKTRSQILAALIAGHNAQVDDYKQIKLGSIDFGADAVIADCVTDENADTYTNMSNLIMSGFEYRVRDDNGTLYIDVSKSFGSQGTQIIGVNRNLLTAARSIDPSAIVTVLKPMGPSIDTDTTTTDTDITPANMNITTVNGGSPYIRDENLVSQFGEIVRSQTFDNATNPANLLSLGKAWMNSRPFATIQLQVSVVDLAFIRGAPDDLWYGNSYRTITPQMGIDAFWRISQQTINLVEPGTNTVTLGDRVVGQETYNNTIIASADAIRKYRAAVDRQNQRVSALADAVSKLQQEVTAPVQYLTGNIIDVSEWQGVIDWTSVVSAGLALPIIRVQHGSDHQDLKYAENIQKCLSAGHTNYAVYAYFAATSTSDAQQEAKDYYTRTQAVVQGKTQPVFYAIDVEESTMTNMRGGVEAYMTQLNALGVPDSQIVLYIANQLYDTFGLNVSRASAVWIPSYGINDGTVANSTKPTHAYDLWQYTSTGSVSGITGNVDMSTDPSDNFRSRFLVERG